MTTRMVLKLSGAALLLGGSMVGCTAQGGHDGLASASSRDASRSARAADINAARAARALGKHDTLAAVSFAEAAVEFAPHDADKRVLLGQSYLQAGRFTSARQAFADALDLAPDNGRAALNFALASIATGDRTAARQALDTHADAIAPADRGLALALAGDPASAVELLTQVARSPQTSATVRQNLALSLALAGNWPMARVVAAADLSPADVDARLEHWAAFAQPQASSDQVAALLGVVPVSDAGQPVTLALNASTPAVAVAAVTAPAPVVPAAESDTRVAEVAVARPAAEQVAVAAPIPTSVPVPAPAAVAVQDVPPPTLLSTARVDPSPMPAIHHRAANTVAALIRPAHGPMKVALRAPAPTPMPAVAKGDWYVQIGAFDSPAVAKDAWGRAKRRMPALAQHGPSGMEFSSKAGTFYRLSVGGYARIDAVSLCLRYRKVGGQCFVRAGAGDQIAQWLRPGTARG